MSFGYKVCSKKTHAAVTLDILKYIPQIFDQQILNLLEKRTSFEIGGKRLLRIKENLGNIIAKLIEKRGETKNHIPPNLEKAEIFGSYIELNLRDEIDQKLFWFNNVYKLMEEAANNNMNLIFIAYDGSNTTSESITLDNIIV